MWDNPRRLNMLAGFLVGLVVLAFTLTALQLGLRSTLWPVREVTIQGELKHTMRSEIEAALQQRVAGNFFSVDVDGVRSALERLPWVRRAAVRRVWPDRLEVTLEEHVALARWGESALVNTYGERFVGGSKEALPRFSGPRGSESELARRYARFVQSAARGVARYDYVDLRYPNGFALRVPEGKG